MGVGGRGFPFINKNPEATIQRNATKKMTIITAIIKNRFMKIPAQPLS